MKTKDPRDMLADIVIPLGGIDQCPFDKSRCRFHFGIPGLKLGIDVDSGYIGRHNWKRHNRATVMGWHYFKFTAHEIRCGLAKEQIEKFIGRGR